MGLDSGIFPSIKHRLESLSGKISKDLVERGGPISLLTPEGLERYANAIKQSNGTGVVLVHPRYPLENWQVHKEELSEYEQYEANLRHALARYSQLGLPIIILQEERTIDALNLYLKDWGINEGNVYVVSTDNGTPELPRKYHRRLSELAQQLHELGLNKAVVAGTYLWKGNSSIPIRYEDRPFLVPLPNIYNKNSILGCVGTAIEAFAAGGVHATPGFATYPLRRGALQ